MERSFRFRTFFSYIITSFATSGLTIKGICATSINHIIGSTARKLYNGQTITGKIIQSHPELSPFIVFGRLSIKLTHVQMEAHDVLRARERVTLPDLVLFKIVLLAVEPTL